MASTATAFTKKTTKTSKAAAAVGIAQQLKPVIEAHVNAAKVVLAEQVAEAPKNETGPKRGDRVDGGIYIGERNGLKWIVYRHDLVADTIEAFDAGPEARLKVRRIDDVPRSWDLVVSSAELAEPHEACITIGEVAQLAEARAVYDQSHADLLRADVGPAINRMYCSSVAYAGSEHNCTAGISAYVRPSKNGARRLLGMQRAIDRALRIRDWSVEVWRDVRFLRGVLHVVRARIGLPSWQRIASAFNMQISIHCAPGNLWGEGFCAMMTGHPLCGTNVHRPGSQEWVNDVALTAAYVIGRRIGAWSLKPTDFYRFQSMIARGLFDLDAVTDQYELVEPLGASVHANAFARLSMKQAA